MLDRLDLSRFTCYALDLRGTGDSDPTDDGHTFTQYVADVAAVVDTIGLERFTFVAHSMGAGVAYRFALDHGDRLTSMILANPLSPHGTAHLTTEVVEAINGLRGSDDGVRAIILGGFVTPPTDIGYLDQLVTDGVGWSDASYLGMMDEMRRFEIGNRLAEITCPTLITWADGDTVIPFDGIVAAYTGIPNSSLEVWHGVGHDSIIEAPDRFAALVDRFVSEIAGTTPHAEGVGAIAR
ncbi:MAG: alpha/beta hydrolase [Actinomycetota bacterium]|nr:alpha/beta hydrolase [Actinomycetota bacterium]